MDEIAEAFAAMEWVYADRDPAACAELACRIAAAGSTPDEFLTYSELVAGVTFQLDNVRNGEPFEITEWNNLERAIIGSFLGKIAADSYCLGRFLASALVYGISGNDPGEGFYSLAEEVGLLGNSSETARLTFWFNQVRLARAWYAAHPA